jgi:hypothetical protein
VVIAGRESDPETGAMIRMIRDRYLPSVTVHFRSPQAFQALAAVAPFTGGMIQRDGKTTAYVCTGRTCSAPVTTPEKLLELLSEKN